MTHPIIKTDNYILITSDEEIKEGDWVIGVSFLDLPIGKVIEKYGGEFTAQSLNGNKHGLAQYDSKKIIAHLPLNNSPILEGVPLLPPFEEIKYDFAEMFYTLLKATYPDFDEWVEAKEYKKSKEKYKFTEEDVRKAMWAILSSTCELSEQEDIEHNIKCILQDSSKSEPKLPIGFKVAIKNMKTAIDRHTITGWENVIIDGGVVQGRWIFE